MGAEQRLQPSSTLGGLGDLAEPGVWPWRGGFNRQSQSPDTEPGGCASSCFLLFPGGLREQHRAPPTRQRPQLSPLRARAVQELPPAIPVLSGRLSPQARRTMGR